MKLIDEINYLKFIDKQYDDNLKLADVKKNDVESLVLSAERFQSYVSQKTALKSFVEKLLLQDSQDTKEEDEDEDSDVRKNEISLLTLHSSKGLEFEKVYLIGMEEKTLPHKKSIQENGINENLTCICWHHKSKNRACDDLLTRNEKYTERTYLVTQVGSFLSFPENSFIEQDRTTFGHLTPKKRKTIKKISFTL